MIVGAIDDAVLGPAVVVGTGGIFAEVLEDVSLRVAPLTRRDAEEMIREIKAFPVLEGARGRPRTDQPALVELLLNVSHIAMALREHVIEFDLNPVRVLPEGRGVVALDALVIRK